MAIADTISLKKLIGVLQLWYEMDPPKSVVPTALALKGVHFDFIVAYAPSKIPLIRICSHLTSRLAGRAMAGCSISEAPNTHWMNSLLGQLQVARYARNLVYQVDRETMGYHLSNIHRLIVPLTLDGQVIDEYLVASQAIAAQ